MGVYSEPRQAEDTIYFDVFPRRSLRRFFFDACCSLKLKLRIIDVYLFEFCFGKDACVYLFL